MAREYGYRVDTKGEFLSAFENGSIQGELAASAKADDGKASMSEERSWNNSYAFLDLVLRDEGIPNAIQVTCEQRLRKPGGGPIKRADVVILGPAAGEGCPRKAEIIELKQWDRYFVQDCRSGRVRTRKGERINLGNPVEQASDYLGLYTRTYGSGGEAAACVFMHNLSRDEDSTLRVCSEEREGVTVFYRGEIELMRSYLRDRFVGDLLTPRKAIERAREGGYWPEGLPETPGLLREKLLSEKYRLAEQVMPGAYDYRPTKAGEDLGIRAYVGYDDRREKDYTVCAFTDMAMRNLAALL